MIGPFRWILASLIAALGSLAARADEAIGSDATAPTPARAAEFENRIRPLLADRCLRCHGPLKQESNLRLDSRAAAIQGGESGPAIVPGRPAESLLVRAIRHEGDLRMPPDRRLADEQVATLTRWIAEGAPWTAEPAGVPIRRGGITPEDRAFWSLRPIQPPAPPGVRDRGWIRTDVDRWILSALESRGIHPVRPADRRTLIRRATFDLTGLPPTPEEVDAFLFDGSPDAFARVVDRLLASPAYGERWGRHWLDVVRYADTAGETADYPVREAYRYRNYVMDAFNRDVPYDQFVREQVAGDILAEADPGSSYARQVTATGFLALSRRFGFDSENYHFLTIQDTIDTTGQAFLGLTLGCARCHDHKYDPVSMRDYYALYGIFDSTRYPFAGSEQKPNMRSMASLLPRKETSSLRDQMAQFSAVPEGAQPSPDKVVVVETLDELDGDFELQKPSSGGSLGVLVSPWLFEGQPDVVAAAQSPFTNLTRRSGNCGVRFPGGAVDHRVWQRLWPARTIRTTTHLHVNLDVRAVADAGPGIYRFIIGHGTDGPPALVIEIGATAILDGAGVSLRSIKPGTWYNILLDLDLEGGTYSGVVGAPGDLVRFADRPVARGWDGTIDTVRIEARGGKARPPLDVDNLAVREAAIPPIEPIPSAAPQPGDSRGSLADLIRRRDDSLAYAMAEGTPGDARIQKRGEPTKPGDTVPRRFLEVIGGDSLLPQTAGSGRRELAEWLTRPENPLTARVMVNRIWAGHFGVGLVATENDFGRRGRPPSHPGLLDDLARRFRSGGWSMKSMHRLIMLSSTYQLSSESASGPAEADPADELLWRFPRRRLDAESIRDAILMIGGGLDRSRGGAHPFPPVGTTFTQHAPFGAVYPSDRRSIYLMTQRIRRHPFLALFDGPDTNASTPRRSVTTVPTQALFFMNDPFVHEQARGFADRLRATAADEHDRLVLAYRMALAREPLAAEFIEAREFSAGYRRQLEADGVPVADRDRATWSALARTLFAGNEFLSID